MADQAIRIKLITLPNSFKTAMLHFCARPLSLIILTSWLAACAPNSFKTYQEFLRANVYDNPKIQAQYLRNNEFQLHFRSFGTAKQAVAVWIHGTPGGWSDIGRLFAHPTFNAEVKLVSIDRPGWGQSQKIDQPQLITDFDQISTYIGPLLAELKQAHPDVPLILVGHSWGGSLVPALAADYPNLVDAVMVLAGGLDPKLTQPRWYNKLARRWPVNRIIGDRLRAANVEVYTLAPQLAARVDELRMLPMPVLVIQGDKDKLVSPRNADFAEAHFHPQRSRVVRLKGQGHLLQIERSELIAQCILAMAQGNLATCDS